MKILLISLLLVAGSVLYLNHGTKKSDLLVFAKYHSQESVVLDGHVVSIDEAISQITAMVRPGKVVDLLVTGNKVDKAEIENLAERIRALPAFKGHNVVVVIES